MAKINGTNLLVYCDGVLIATQKSCTVSWEQDLIDTTNKSSGGWEEHENGMRRATCDFDALYSTTGLSAESLITYITGRTSLVLVIDGGGFPIVGEARPKNLTVNTPLEDAVAISGSFTFDGPAWMLTGTFVNLLTDPDDGGESYDTTLTVSGLAITSAVQTAADPAYVWGNGMSVTTGDVFKLITFLTLTSGELPSVAIDNVGTGEITNIVQLVEGVNVITLTATGDDTDGRLRFGNSIAGNWATSNIYVFKV